MMLLSSCLLLLSNNGNHLFSSRPGIDKCLGRSSLPTRRCQLHPLDFRSQRILPVGRRSVIKIHGNNHEPDTIDFDSKPIGPKTPPESLGSYLSSLSEGGAKTSDSSSGSSKSWSTNKKGFHPPKSVQLPSYAPRPFDIGFGWERINPKSTGSSSQPSEISKTTAVMSNSYLSTLAKNTTISSKSSKTTTSQQQQQSQKQNGELFGFRRGVKQVVKRLTNDEPPWISTSPTKKRDNQQNSRSAPSKSSCTTPIPFEIGTGSKINNAKPTNPKSGTKSTTMSNSYLSSLTPNATTTVSSTFQKKPPQSTNRQQQQQQQSQKENGELFGFRRGVKHVTNEAVTKATTTSQKLSQLVDQGTWDARFAAEQAATSAAALAAKGQSDARIAAERAATSAAAVAARGQSDWNSISDATTAKANEISRWIANSAASATIRSGATASADTNATTTTRIDPRSWVLSFTGRPEYDVGDITREVLRRIATSNISDVLLLIKIALAIGSCFTPLADALPISVLLGMLNVTIEKQIGGQVLETVAGSLDHRFTTAIFNNDDKYQLGDAVKRSAMAGILRFTGEKTYETGDIKRAAKAAIEENRSDSGNSGGTTGGEMAKMKIKPRNELVIDAAFEDWDTNYRASHPELNELDFASDPKMNPKDMDIKIATKLVEDGVLLGEESTERSSVKYCMFCGTKLPGVARYCFSCGKEQSGVIEER